MKFIILLLLVVTGGFAFNDAFAYTISDDATGGDCSTIGTWDSASKTCTLSGDVNEGIVIGSNYLTLDGNDHVVTGPGTTNDAGYGIHLNVKTHVIIKNIVVKDFLYGIFLQNSVINEIKDNTSLNNWSSQIRLEDSNDNIISNNILTGLENGYGILIGGANNNVHDNTVTLNDVGIRSLGDDTIISNNVVENNGVGIDGTKNSLIEENTVNNNSAVGIELGWGIDGSTVNNNIISNNELGLNLFGTNLIAFDNEISNNVLGLQLGHHATVYHNNLISNTVEAKMDQGNIASFNTSILEGGNYWSDYSPNCLDENHDNFCDEPYPFKETMKVDDEYIWTVQDGWLTTINTPSDTTVDATDSSGATFDYSVSATHDGSSMAVTCDIVSGSIFSIGVTEVLCTADNGIKSTFSVTVNPLEPIIHPNSPCDDGCTHEGNNPDLKIFASGYVENPIDGVNIISSIWKDPDGIVVYDKILQSNAQGQFNNEFDNPMFVRDMRDSGLYTTTYQYDDVILEYTWNYLTTVYVPEPEDTIPPVVVVPNNKAIEATSNNPSPVTFSVSVTDDTDGILTPACSHNSGNNFPIGLTTVTCTATDAAGNSNSKSFTITVTYDNSEPIPETDSSETKIDARATKSSYENGDTVLIIGSITNYDDSSAVNYLTISPDNDIVNIGQLIPNSDGSFDFSFTAGNSLWKTNGDYIIKISYRADKSEIIVNYVGGEAVISKPVEPVEPIEPVEPVEPVEPIEPEPTPESEYEVIIETAQGSGAPGCEETSQGCYIPGTATVAVGGKVIFSNTDSAAHTFTSGDPTMPGTVQILFDSGIAMAGSTFEWSPTEEGVVDYFCMVHPWMQGIILVGEGTAPPPRPTPDTSIELQVSVNDDVYDLNDLVGIQVEIDGISGSQKVAIDVTDPNGSTVISRSLTFTSDNEDGEIEFRISEEFKTGTYKVTATTSDDGKTIRDNAYFKVKSQYNSFKITSVETTDQQGNSSDLKAGEIGFIKVELESNKSIATLVTVNIFDYELTSIGIGSVKTTLSSGTSEIILSFMIPADAAVGPSDIYVNAFSDWPSNGGIPLTGEVSSVEDIQ